MNKLNKRQIIILVVAALFVLWAIYDLLIAGPASKKAKMEPKPVAVETFVSTITADLAQYKMAGVNAYIATNAEMSWGASPFWEHASFNEFSGNEKGGGSVVKIVYSGYVDTGRKKMAIINGWEYEAGEELDVEGYVLKSVSPSRVLITNSNTGGEIYVPLQE
jgi:hypothetical protein